MRKGVRNSESKYPDCAGLSPPEGYLSSSNVSRRKKTFERGPEHRRYSAALAVTGTTIADVAQRAGISRHFLYDVLAGKRSLSERARTALTAAVGPAGWRYAIGETDELPPPSMPPSTPPDAAPRQEAA